MKLILLLFAVLLLIIVGIQFSQRGNISIFPKTNPSVTIKNQTFSVDLAKSEKEKETGLSQKSSMPESRGMLFVFDKADLYPFWMRDMEFPIDIIFINDNKIVTVYSSVLPPKNASDALPIYKPTEKANMVLEINAGLSDKYNFTKGDEVKVNK